MNKTLRTIAYVANEIALAAVRPDLSDAARPLPTDEDFLESEANKRDISVEELLLIYGTDYDSVIVWTRDGPEVKISWKLRHAIRNTTAIFLA